MRFSFFIVAALVALSACTPVPTTTAPQLGSDGKPLPKLYRIPANGKSKIPYEVLDAVNALRAASGASAFLTRSTSALRPAFATAARCSSSARRRSRTSTRT